jgi:heterodisulfide reductase subunit B
MEELLSFEYSGELKVLHLLDVVCNRVGLDVVRRKVMRELRGLKVAPYYGCLLVRPPEVCAFDDAENPTTLDNVMAALGAEPVKWSYKTECCGASLALIQPEIVEKLVGEIVEMAVEAGAACIATACPLCSTNLETRQQVGLPIFFFTELMGLAFGLEGCERWFRYHLVETEPALRMVSSEHRDSSGESSKEKP